MDIKAFFDHHAPLWDSYQTPETLASIVRILATAAIRHGARVLDVGAGTGILYPYFHDASVGAYTAVDVSPEMTRLFRTQYPSANVLEADYEEPIVFSEPFDAIMIFNAFPHFRDEAAVFSRSHAYLKPGGRLFICHSLNREGLNEHHRRAGMAVAGDVLISDNRMIDLYTRTGFAFVRVENTDIFYSEGTK